MAERFGGRYSPGGGGDPRAPGPRGPDPRAPEPGRGEKRARWLFLFSLPFAVKAFFNDPVGLAYNLAAFATLVLAAWMTREGARAADAYDARTVARRPAIPRKIFGSLLTGLGLGLGAWQGGSFAAPVLLGVIGTALHLFAFRPDPLGDKGMEGIDTVQQNRASRFVAEGEAYLTEMRAAAERAGDRQILAQVDRFAVTARALFRTIEEDPRDIAAARRYLGVYLMGARDATVKFASLWAKTRDAYEARDAYIALLIDLETNFARRTTALLADNRSDLDIEIDVLRDRLKREGVELTRQM